MLEKKNGCVAGEDAHGKTPVQAVAQLIETQGESIAFAPVSADDDPKPASVPTLLVRQGQTVAEAKLAAGFSKDANVVIAHVRDCRKASTTSRI